MHRARFGCGVGGCRLVNAFIQTSSLFRQEAGEGEERHARSRNAHFW